MTPLPDCTNTRELLAIGDAAVYLVADVESIRAERDALKAKLDAMAEWAAKVPHAENCNSLCPYCEGLEADYHTACSVGPCSCHLSRIPSDLIARGKEISEMERRLKEYEAKAVSCPWCSQDENPVLQKLMDLLADKKRVDWWLAGMPAGWDRHRVDEAMKVLPADAAMKGEGR